MLKISSLIPPSISVLALLLLLTAGVRAEESSIVITSPLPWQVVQRVSFDPVTLAASPEDRNARGFADVEIHGTLPEDAADAPYLEYQLAGVTKQDITQQQERTPPVWRTLRTHSSKTGGREFSATLLMPAGGWYRLELRIPLKSAGSWASGVIEPFGVGEVFLVAGQSYATNTNEERLRVSDAAGRVSAFNLATGTWAVAHDPQPAPDGSDGGSIWPAMGDALVASLDVPVAFVNVAVGGTSSEQWMPGGALHAGLIHGGNSAGRFRAVLWQQGESDVIAKTPKEAYIANVQKIRKAAVRAWGFEPVWLAAKSTLHPTVYNDPEGEGRIRDALEQLSALPGFGAGPDTDLLAGDNRGDANSRRHFSAIGQRRAAAMWHETLMSLLQKTPSGVEAASFLLADMKLLSPCWSSEVVYRESCVLRQIDREQPVLANLAFPAAEILCIESAGRTWQYDSSEAKITHGAEAQLQFSGTGPVASITDAEMYLPPDSPHSYKHRQGNPDQNLLYRPGRWFHDHNVEVTYRRNTTAEPVQGFGTTYGTLPKTLARLKDGLPLTLGVSGDSISTGLDASVKTSAPPFQPGYPELVAAQLQVLFDSTVTLENRAVSGWSVANGVTDLESMLVEKPDLIIVAYGMNDVGRRDPKWFADQTKIIIERSQAAIPNVEILLVSTMLGNNEWIHTPRDMFAQYRDELKAMAGPGVALADVTAVWELMLRRKPNFDLTGNGLNHPNDFGHRLYAQTVLPLFME